MKKVTAILFLLCLFSFSIFNLFSTYIPLNKAISIKKQNTNELIDTIESTMQEEVLGKFYFIEGYGYLQKLLNKQEESNLEIVKDEKGFLHYSYFANGPNPVDELVNNMSVLKNSIKDKEIEVVSLMPPDKYVRGYTQFSKGLPYNYANETADDFLEGMKNIGINTIDFRENLQVSGIPQDELFFKTDHHWKIGTSFWAYTELVKEINKDYGEGLDPDGFYTNLDHYNQITYKHSYLGSIGRRTGSLYSGLDDFTLIYPKFKTDYTYYNINNTEEKKTEGRFEDALISTYSLNMGDIKYSLQADKYFAYLFGNHALAHITNHLQPEGPKVLFIKDSYSVPMASFLSTVCSEVYLVDPRYYKENIIELVNELELDYVFVSFYPPNLTEEFFSFDKTPISH